MVKQLTAIILALAIAYPFCCCFGSLATQAPAQDAHSPSPPPTRSCCQAKSLPSDNKNESPPKDDAPSCPSGCACKQVYPKAENDSFKPTQVLLDSNLVDSSEVTEQFDSPFAVEIFSKVLAWRPPPLKNTYFRSLYCISRT